MSAPTNTGVTFDTPEIAAAARKLRLAAAEAGLPDGMEISISVNGSPDIRGYFGTQNYVVSPPIITTGPDFDTAAKSFLAKLPPTGIALAERKRREAARLIAEAEHIEDEVNTEAVMAPDAA